MAPAEALERMTVEISLNVPKAESEYAAQYPEAWDELAAQIAGMKERGESTDLPHESA